jgi:hypothetical protein
LHLMLHYIDPWQFQKFWDIKVVLAGDIYFTLIP